jgi:hypothetical protein
MTSLAELDRRSEPGEPGPDDDERDLFRVVHQATVTKIPDLFRTWRNGLRASWQACVDSTVATSWRE